MKKILIIFLYLLISSPLFAEDLYVRPANDCSGSPCGATNGSDWDNAFNGFSDISWGAGAGSVSDGDTLYLSGGATTATYSSGSAGTELTIGSSGSSNVSRVTLTVSTADPDHDGTAIIQCTQGSGSQQPKGIVGANLEFITISGVDSNKHIRITGCINPGNKDNGLGVELYGNVYPSGNIVEYVQVDACNNGVNISGEDSELRYSSVTDIRGDYAVRTGANGSEAFDLLSVHNNTIQTNVDYAGTGYGPDGIQPTSDGVSVYNNIIYAADGTAYGGQHNDMVQNSADHTKVYNNSFYDCHDSCFDYDMYHSTSPNNIQIYNNIFWITSSHFRDNSEWPVAIRIYHSSTGAAPTSFDEFRIYNNTFVDYSTGSGGYSPVRFGLDGNCNISSAVTNVEIKNNIFYNMGGGSKAALELTHANSSVTDFNVDYNALYAGGSGNTNIKFNSTTYGTGDWGASIQENGMTGQPLFASYTEDSENNDFNLQSGDTVGKDRGVDLSSYFTTDKDGTTRSGTWDIGAYEYGSETDQITGVTID